MLKSWIKCVRMVVSENRFVVDNCKPKLTAPVLIYSLFTFSPTVRFRIVAKHCCFLSYTYSNVKFSITYFYVVLGKRIKLIIYLVSKLCFAHSSTSWVAFSLQPCQPTKLINKNLKHKKACEDSWLSFHVFAGIPECPGFRATCWKVSRCA